MHVYHQSRLPIFRQPFGAVPVQTRVRLAIQVQPEQDDIRAVFLCYAYGLYTFQESRLRLACQCDFPANSAATLAAVPTGLIYPSAVAQSDQDSLAVTAPADVMAEQPEAAAAADLAASATSSASPGIMPWPVDAAETTTAETVTTDAGESVTGDLYQGVCPMPSEPCLFFYWFEIQTATGRFFYTSNNNGSDGSGWLGPNRPRYLPHEPHLPVAFQITVYDARFKVPDWLQGGVMYQIFPDRFRRDRDFQIARFTRPEIAAPERIFHHKWDEDVDYQGLSDTGYLACDFFGGSINGIREKLDYLQELGITILYLNPVFRARSNHRYDTGDYEQVDPLLGSNEDLAALCAEARARGIRVILDGVFSHTGADSRYFNKYGRYQEIGAFQEMCGEGFSEYGNWFTFHRKGYEFFYDSWWGFPDLPSVNEHDLSYRQYMTGPDGVVRQWLRRGISGWRLDVSDELPDSFLREMRATVREENAEAALLGEVWEDASHKISYGSYRDFLLGRTHDNIMGYPFQQALTGWLLRHFPARHLANQLESLREHYPLTSFYSSMNLISSHDIPRAITTLAGLPDPGHRDDQARIHLSAAARQRGIALLRLAWMFQVAFPGIATIYYGDECAMEGYRDPFNRRTFPWGRENTPLQAWFARLGQLRRQLPVLRTGFFRILLADDDIFAFERTLTAEGLDILDRQQAGPRRVLAIFNRHKSERITSLDGRTLRLPGFGGILEYDQTQVRTGDSR